MGGIGECCHLNDEFNLIKTNDEIVELLMRKGNEMQFTSSVYNQHITNAKTNENQNHNISESDGNMKGDMTWEMAQEQQKTIEKISKRYIDLGKFLHRKLQLGLPFAETKTHIKEVIKEINNDDKYKTRIELFKEFTFKYECGNSV